ncbi:hypothetical protein AB1Y20_011914 [Prymnesium parvum]|uniref:Anoctamin n=1 Tax=Prymnesium parvum TaxID=97485 RepID=A0AB34IQK2_PRYPA
MLRPSAAARSVEEAPRTPAPSADASEQSEAVDFVLLLSDVSAYRSSKAKRFLRSMWLFGASQLRDVEAALALLCAALEREGFGCAVLRRGGGEVVLQLRGSGARLRREAFREQLEAWVHARPHLAAAAEFEPLESDARLSAARRIALLHPPLEQLLPQLQHSVLRGGDLLALGQCFPLHDRRFVMRLLIHLSRHFFLQAQMLHQLRNEYGEKVAFYFGFRTFVQRWLVAPAVGGAVLSLAARLSPRLPAYVAPLFGLAISLWGAAMLEAWRLQQKELAALWGVEQLREAEVVRPQFFGERSISRLTGEPTLYYPRWKRVAKRCVTVPALLAQLLVLTGVICGLYGAWISIHEAAHHPALKTLLVVLLSVSWGLLVEVLNWQVFMRLASALNSWENYRTTIEFEHQLALKVFAFVFVDGFLWYFLLAFLHIPFGAQLRAALSLRADGFDQAFWMHALVTSVSSLLLVPLPLASLWSIVFPFARFLHTSPSRLLHTSAARFLQTSASRFLHTCTSPRGGYSRLPLDRSAAAAAAIASYAASHGAAGSPPACHCEEDGCEEVPCEEEVRCEEVRCEGEEAGCDAAQSAEAACEEGRCEPAEACAPSRPAGPSAVLSAAVAASPSDSSGSDDDACLSTPWSRSMFLRSILVRRLNWLGLLRAQRGHRSVIAKLRQFLRSAIDADSLVDEGAKPPYDPLLDYAHLALEFGYVLMFTVVWPLAPLACLLLSALEQRAAACRLCVSSRRPIPHRCNGLGTGNAWYGVFTFLAWLSVPVNCGMMALATQQLDVYFGGELAPFERLLLAVVAEHLLLAAQLAIRLAFPESPDLLLADAQRVEREFKRKYLRGVRADEWRPRAAAAARLGWAYPASGPTSGGVPLELHGEHLGKAVSRGEIVLSLSPPGESRAVPLVAAFVSERKLSCVLPAAARAGVATIALQGGGGSCAFRYYGEYSLARLKPSGGPLRGGTAVRLLGSGFVQTGEATVCVRMHGVERRVQAFWHSEGEVRFMTPDFSEPGDARVQLSLNGQQYTANELTYHYHSSMSCTIM